MADAALTQDVFDILHAATHYQQVKKGANEGKSRPLPLHHPVILAGDTDPLPIILTIPALCEEQNVPYVFVQSKAELGRACGVARPIIAACINSDAYSDLNDQIRLVKDKVERLAI
ncbi:unnamed protein product [Penicillium olsonii]|nr:unnamed protein product [Penicillium olsonii]CAG7922610.1 unnamed protein product [Penicillium olsonii]